MKKIISSCVIAMLLTFSIFTMTHYAAELSSIDVQTDKTTVRPGENVTLTVTFGEDLGAYTFDVAYDNNLFEYVSAEGGTANDTGTSVKVVYYDATGGTSPRANMSATFKAKEGITTSNPTELMVTAEGLANADASVTYDDITTPIVKNITVEPEYQDYTIGLVAKEAITIGEETDMQITYSSPMGHYYQHARLVASATTPQGATVTLVGTEATSTTKHDIIQSGWGDAAGYPIGGKDFSQVLDVVGTFSSAGEYAITLKLIDRDNSDSVIAEKTFNYNVGEPTGSVPPETTIPEEPVETPTELPKTGINQYAIATGLLLLIAIGYGLYHKKNTK